MQPNEGPAYRRPARILHWLVAVLVILNIPGGILMTRLDGGALQDFVFNNHRSIGFVVLVLALVRLAYRLTHAPRPLPESMPALQRFAAEAVHWALYGFMILTPIVGWLATNAYGAPISIFGLFELPVLVAKDEALSKILFGAHAALGVAFAAAVLAHVGAALFHTFVQKDGIIDRMWPI